MSVPPVRPYAELEREIERLEPLAQAERLAQIADVENHWKGSGRALEDARVALEHAKEHEQAMAFARDAQLYRQMREQEASLGADIAACNAEIAAFTEEQRTYFARANALMRWTDRNGLGSHPYMSATQFDSQGKPLDVSPRDINQPHRPPIVPDDEWEAVKNLREIHLRRARVGQAHTNVRNAIADLQKRWPAFSVLP